MRRNLNLVARSFCEMRCSFFGLRNGGKCKVLRGGSGMAVRMLACAFGADSFHKKIRAVVFVSFGQAYGWYGNGVEANYAPAILAEKVNVLVVIVFFAVAKAQFIACAAVAVFDGVNQMVLTEYSERAKDVRFVDEHKRVFKLFHRFGELLCRQRLDYHYAVGGGSYSATFQQFYVFALVHFAEFAISLQIYVIMAKRGALCGVLQRVSGLYFAMVLRFITAMLYSFTVSAYFRRVFMASRSPCTYSI